MGPGWDTTPVLGGESVVEEAFVDVWSDLIWGTWGGAAPGPYLRRGSMGEADEERTLKRDSDFGTCHFSSRVLFQVLTA